MTDEDLKLVEKLSNQLINNFQNISFNVSKAVIKRLETSIEEKSKIILFDSIN